MLTGPGVLHIPFPHLHDLSFGLVFRYVTHKPGYRAFQLLHNAGDWQVTHWSDTAWVVRG